MQKTSSSRVGTRRERLAAFARFLWRRFRDDKCFETAGALSYTTLFAVVPLLAAVFAVLSLFPAFVALRENVSEFIFRSFVPATGRSVQGYLLQFADNASRLTAVGILLLLATALLLMASIEARFNRIWRVPAPRRGSARLLLYWAALTLGPLLAAIGIGVSSWVYAQPLWRGLAGHGVAGFRLWALAPFLITWIGLTVLYELVPNCRVRWRVAILGALAAAVVFELARKGFVLYVGNFGNYREIYGALAAIPLFLIWIYVWWVIVLLGATFTATMTAFEYRHTSELLPPGCEFAGLLQVAQRFALAQRAGRGLRETELSAQARFLTTDLLQRYLGDLQQAAVIRRAEDGAWVMVRDPDSVCVGDLFRAGHYRLHGDTQACRDAVAQLAPEAWAVLQCAEAALRQNLAVSLRAVCSAAVPADVAKTKGRPA